MGSHVSLNWTFPQEQRPSYDMARASQTALFPVSHDTVAAIGHFERSFWLLSPVAPLADHGGG
jgi:hypothetical protein